MLRRHLKPLKRVVGQGVDLEYIDDEILAFATFKLNLQRETYA